MPEKILNTRIQLKYDTYENFTTNNPVLKAGEVAIATVPTGGSLQQVTPPAVVIKVGDGTSEYNDLPFASALAADVYAWAKKANLEVADMPNITTAKVTDFATSTDARIDTKIKAIDATVNATAGQFITGITQTDGKITAVTSAAIPAAPEYTIVAGSTAGTITLEKDGEPVAGATDIKVNGWDALVTEVGKKYVKPAGGIPATDLASAVQANLTAASTAIQEADITTGSVNGTIAVNGNNVSVYGLGTAAYTNANAYATASQGTLAESAVQSVTTGTTQGAINVDGTPVAVNGLGNAAYVNTDAFDAAGTANTIGSAINATVSAMNTRLGNAESDIDELQSQIGGLSGAMHFVGVSTTNPTGGTVTIDGEPYSPTSGDVCLYGNKEYVYNGTAWVELGDEGSYALKTTTVNGKPLSANITLNAGDVGADPAGTAANAIADLTLSNVAIAAGNTISAISQTNGVVAVSQNKISITASQVGGSETFATTLIPTLEISKINGLQTALDSKLEESDVEGIETNVAALQSNMTAVQGNISTINAALANKVEEDDVTAAISTAINAIDVSDSAVTNQYVTAVAQADGKIAVTRKQIQYSEIAGTPTEKTTTFAAGDGLAVTGADGGTVTYSIDPNTTFVFYCGTSTELVD